MRFLKLCFVLIVFVISAKAQEKETCFYHVSFYRWQCDYCYGRDTIAIQDFEGNFVHDTVIMDTSNRKSYFTLEIKDSASLSNACFEVRSIDGKINYEVKSFFVVNRGPGSVRWGVLNEGSCLNEIPFKRLYNSNSGESFELNHLKIFDPKLKKEILLPGINIYVK